LSQKKHPVFRLWRYAVQHRARLMLASIYSVLNKLFDLAPPVLIGMAVDIAVRREGSVLGDVGIPNLTHQLYLLGFLTFLIWGLESIFDYVADVEWRNLAQSIEHGLRVDTYRHVQSLEMAYFEDRSTGGLMSILNDDINQLERFLDRGANELWQTATTVILVGALYLYLAPDIGWLAVIPIPLILWGSSQFQKRIAPRYADVRERVSILNDVLSNNLSGIATIKSYTAEPYEVEQVRVESENYRQSNRRAIILSSLFIPVIRMFILMGFMGILIFGGQRALDEEITVASYSVMIFMTQRLLWPLTRLGEVIDLFQRAMASTTRILDVLDTEAQIIDGSVALPLESVEGKLVFEKVNFAYSNGVIVTKDLSLNIEAGQTVAIVGATGSGKSTLVKLLLRFYDTQSGCIKVDGHDIRSLQYADLRRAIGVVSQDVFLFHGTVRQNIAYGTFDAKPEDIIHAASIAEAHDFIMALPDGYDTIVGERGQKLSGGQRQRISIARAVLKDPPILVLDEATASVDNETEAAIQRSMERITVNRTTLVIAHRLSTIRHADKIFVLEGGSLSEEGTHDSLINSGGIYDKLWKVQTGESRGGFFNPL
jgi:ATP-binding cassette subfamily B protein